MAITKSTEGRIRYQRNYSVSSKRKTFVFSELLLAKELWPHAEPRHACKAPCVVAPTGLMGMHPGDYHKMLSSAYILFE